MKALLLVGGKGTRLTPLTLVTPKPFIPFCNEPMVEHLIIQFKKAGVREFVFAISDEANKNECIRAIIRNLETEHDVRITSSVETELLGTGGAIYNAREHLQGDFIVVNSDIMCTFPIAAMMEAHRGHGALGTVLTTQVADPSRYGVITSDTNGKILQFIEKPREYISNKINAGMYILNESVFEYFSTKCSVERDVFPKLASSERGIYMFDLVGFWNDIGTLDDYMEGQKTYLKEVYENNIRSLKGNLTFYPHGKPYFDNDKNLNIIGPVLLHKTVTFLGGGTIGPNVVLGPLTTIGRNPQLKDCTVMPNCCIPDDFQCCNSMVSSQGIINCDSRGRLWPPTNELITNEEYRVKPNGQTVFP